MAVYSGPKVVTDGMILHLDKYNEESYLGEPTTNLAVNFSGWYRDASGHSSQGVVTLSDDNWTATVVDTNDNTRHKAYITAAASTEYTFSVKYRNLGGTAPTLRFQVQWRDSADATISYTFPTTATIGITDILGWQQATWTVTSPAGTARVVWYIQDGNDYTGYTHSFQLKEMQFEAKPHTTKWVATGTRSTTNGWRDLSGEGHHADLTSLTYSATNVPNTNVNNFEFSGSSDQGALIDATLYSANAMTISAWVNLDVVPASQTTSFPCILSKRDTETHRSYFFSFKRENSKLYFEIKGTGGQYYTHSSTKTDWAANTWYYVSASYNAVIGFSKLYVNGQSDTGSLSPAQPWTTATNPLSEIPSTTANAYVGRTHAGIYEFDGQIDVVKFYDRALSAIEVLQNFNATKGRYGL